MLDRSGSPSATNSGTAGQVTAGGNSATVVIGSGSDPGSSDGGGGKGLHHVGLDGGGASDSTGQDSLSVELGDESGDIEDHLPDGDSSEVELSFSVDSEDLGGPSPWAPLHAMLDATEPEDTPEYRPFTPGEGVEGSHALELRAESMFHHAERGAQRTGTLDRTEVGVSDDNRDFVAGRDRVAVDGMLDEHTGHGLVHVADEVEMNVAGPMRVQAHLEENIIMAGVMRDEFERGTFVTAAMSDDMAAGLGLRCTAPLDLWVHGLTEMEERPERALRTECCSSLPARSTSASTVRVGTWRWSLGTRAPSQRR